MKETALVLVDVQDSFLGRETYSCLRQINIALNDANFDKVIATRLVNSQESNLRKQLGWTSMATREEVELHVGIQGVRNLNVVNKTGYGVNDSLLYYLEGVEKVVVMGLDTEASVMQIAGGLFDKGLQTYVDSSGIATSSGGEVHQAGIAILKLILGDSYVVSDYRSILN